jgi:DNA gyrase/topoisomerase IV subunit B
VVPASILAQALLAYAIHEHQQGYARRVDVWLSAEHFTVQDDGRGMGLHREGYVESLVGTLVETPGPVQLHGIGLSLVAAATPRLEVEARRGGTVRKQSFSWGRADAAPSQQPCGPESGTRVTLALPAPLSHAELERLSARVSLWREANPSLVLVVH